MITRYSYMRESLVEDIDGEAYPDPVSLNYKAFQANDFIEAYTLGEFDLERFWLTASKKYGKAELDDIVLTLNGIPHKHFLKIGDTIHYPAKSDIERSFSE